MTEEILKTVPKLVDDVLTRENKDGTFAFLKMSIDEHFFVVDGVAAKVCGLIDGKNCFSDIVGNLKTQGVWTDSETYQEGLQELFSDLKTEGLIQ